MFRLKNTKFIAAFMVLAVFAMGATQLKYTVPVLASEPDWVSFEEIVGRDMTFDDLGRSIKFVYSNVTYTLDGTGSDVLNTESGAESLSLKTPIDFGDGLLGASSGMSLSESSQTAGVSFGKTLGRSMPTTPKLISPARSSSDFSLMVTNASENEEMDWNEEERYDTNGFDFKDIEGEDTTVYDITATTAALNMSGIYSSLNTSLSSIEQAGDFNNDDDQTTSDTKVETLVAGYSDFWTGAINDLRSFIASNNSVAITAVNIQSYNITNVYVCYNITSGYANWVESMADAFLDEEDTTGLGFMQWNLDIFGGVTKTSGFRIGSLVERFGKAIKTSRVTFGTQLKRFNNVKDDWIAKIKNAPEVAAKKAAGVVRTAKTEIKNGLKGAASTIKDAAIDVKSMVTNGANKFIAKPLGAIWSGVTGFVKNIGKWIILALIILAVLFVCYILWTRWMASKATSVMG